MQILSDKIKEKIANVPNGTYRSYQRLSFSNLKKGYASLNGNIHNLIEEIKNLNSPKKQSSALAIGSLLHEFAENPSAFTILKPVNTPFGTTQHGQFVDGCISLFLEEYVKNFDSDEDVLEQVNAVINKFYKTLDKVKTILSTDTEENSDKDVITILDICNHVGSKRLKPLDYISNIEANKDIVTNYLKYRTLSIFQNSYVISEFDYSVLQILTENLKTYGPQINRAIQSKFYNFDYVKEKSYEEYAELSLPIMLELKNPNGILELFKNEFKLTEEDINLISKYFVTVKNKTYFSLKARLDKVSIFANHKNKTISYAITDYKSIAQIVSKLDYSNIPMLEHIKQMYFYTIAIMNFLHKAIIHQPEFKDYELGNIYSWLVYLEKASPNRIRLVEVSPYINEIYGSLNVPTESVLFNELGFNTTTDNTNYKFSIVNCNTKNILKNNYNINEKSLSFNTYVIN